MAIPKQVILHGVNDAGIKILTSDNTSATTYGSLLSIPSIQSITITPQVLTDELKAKSIIRDVYSIFQAAEFSFEHGELDLDTLAAITGSAAVVANGSSPNQTQTMDLTSQAVPYFKLEGKIDYAEDAEGKVGDCHFILHKAKLTSYKISVTSEGYMTISGEGKAVATVADNKVFSIVLNQTAAAIT
jgi:hypothetical protein